MRVKIHWPAPPDSRFGAGCLDEAVGAAALGGTSGVLVGYEIVDDGAAIILDVELSENTLLPGASRVQNGQFSIESSE